MKAELGVEVEETSTPSQSWKAPESDATGADGSHGSLFVYYLCKCVF